MHVSPFAHRKHNVVTGMRWETGIIWSRRRRNEPGEDADPRGIMEFDTIMDGNVKVLALGRVCSARGNLAHNLNT